MNYHITQLKFLCVSLAFHSGCYGDFLLFHTCMYSLNNKSPLILVCVFSKGKSHHWGQFTMNKEFFSFFLTTTTVSLSCPSELLLANLGFCAEIEKNTSCLEQMQSLTRAQCYMNRAVWFSDSLAVWLQDSCSVNKL